jgi:hypothetical protein
MEPTTLRKVKWNAKRMEDIYSRTILDLVFLIVYFKPGQVIIFITIKDYITSFQPLYPSHKPVPVHEPQDRASHKLGQEYETGEEMGVDSIPLANLVQHWTLVHSSLIGEGLTVQEMPPC